MSSDAHSITQFQVWVPCSEQSAKGEPAMDDKPYRVDVSIRTVTTASLMRAAECGYSAVNGIDIIRVESCTVVCLCNRMRSTDMILL